MTLMSVHCKYSVNIYSTLAHFSRFGTLIPASSQGDIIEKSTGERVFSGTYTTEQEAIDACYDWIEEQEE